MLNKYIGAASIILALTGSNGADKINNSEAFKKNSKTIEYFKKGAVLDCIDQINNTIISITKKDFDKYKKGEADGLRHTQDKVSDYIKKIADENNIIMPFKNCNYIK